MHDIGRPAQFFNGFEYPLTEEDSTLVVVVVKIIFLVKENGLAVKIVFVVDEIYLQLGVGFSSSPTVMLMPERRTTS